MHTYAYGFPRIGENREFKTYIENFWENNLTEKRLHQLLDDLENKRLLIYKNFVDIFPIGEFTYYDNILDTAFMFGIHRFKNLKEYFDYARGKKALKLKKYFNTNYHYLVPCIKTKNFKVVWNKPLIYFEKFSQFAGQPLHLIGPFTFFKLSDKDKESEHLFYYLINAYRSLLSSLTQKGANYFHIEEPAFVYDLSSKEIKMLLEGYQHLLDGNWKVNLITYYESVDFLKKLYDLNFYALGLDFVSNEDNLKNVKKIGFPKGKKIICGVIDGKSVRRSNIFEKAHIVDRIRKYTKVEVQNIILSNSAPLFHLPFTLDKEKEIPSKIKCRLSFAKERLYELKLLKDVLMGNTKEAESWCKISSLKRKISISKVNTFSLPEREFLKRKKIHKEVLNLPLFPTTTIGSFPQDKELRKLRRNFYKGVITKKEYKENIRERIKKLIHFQEKIGLDVLVHGEFERSDMVEFFAKHLDGFITTKSGWIISYGTRIYRPPIIWKKIERKKPFTTEEISYAQKLTSKPVKGIITGPVTILAWSYNISDFSPQKIAYQLARQLNKEIKELVKNRIRIIQIDEPAIKEYAPIKRRYRNYYFLWAVASFNLTAKLPPHIQIHTHMCYSEFGDIIQWIKKMNFDVISIETAREKGKILDTFKKIKFKRQIGPGVWDIHSRLPVNKKNIEKIVDYAIKVFGRDNIWINPDCGLKTRNWEEVEVSLKRMVEVAKSYRKLS